ncbi:hypothetical protein HXX76_006530 [Chlamydomonas incerta]|uniref:Cyclic nucleotide-binding domain-containing protein n=1 Tax=Chlamydomonas incerta TaxID=51695 RepID=A0A835T520_CHLIN|nr:hypothetical protein HXX76_006530 [Chlamydomonas incerta]|eukprot:KAG2436218.1 hypothetical protein HXX76_006530 [Chlamydomonas incerta]
MQADEVGSLPLVRRRDLEVLRQRKRAGAADGAGSAGADKVHGWLLATSSKDWSRQFQRSASATVIQHHRHEPSTPRRRRLSVRSVQSFLRRLGGSIGSFRAVRDDRSGQVQGAGACAAGGSEGAGGAAAAGRHVVAVAGRGWWERVNLSGRLDALLPVVHPNTRRRTAWDVFIMCLVIYNAVTVPLAFSYGLPHSRLLSAVEWLLTGLYATDMGVSFRTAFFDDEGTLVRDSWPVAREYLRTWFAIDFFATVPFDLIGSAAGLGGGGSQSQLVVLAFFKTPRLLRLIKLVRLLDRFRNANIIKVAQLFGLMLMAAHWLACVWYIMARYTEGQDWGFDTQQDNNKLTCYLSAFYYSFLLLIGDNVAAVNSYERVFFVITLLAGACFYSAVVGNMAILIASMNTVSVRYRQRLDMTQDALRYMKVPEQHRERVESYFDYITSFSHPTAEGLSFLSDLPRGVNEDLHLHLHARQLQSVYLFRYCEPAFLRLLAARMRIATFITREVIFRQGDLGCEMYIVRKGRVGVLGNSHEVVGLLGEGDFFGEIALITQARRTAKCVALRICDLAVLGSHELKMLMREFPDSAYRLQAAARDRLRQLQIAGRAGLGFTAGGGGRGRSAAPGGSGDGHGSGSGSGAGAGADAGGASGNDGGAAAAPGVDDVTAAEQQRRRERLASLVRFPTAPPSSSAQQQHSQLRPPARQRRSSVLELEEWLMSSPSRCQGRRSLDAAGHDGHEEGAAPAVPIHAAGRAQQAPVVGSSSSSGRRIAAATAADGGSAVAARDSAATAGSLTAGGACSAVATSAALAEEGSSSGEDELEAEVSLPPLLFQRQPPFQAHHGAWGATSGPPPLPPPAVGAEPRAAPLPSLLAADAQSMAAALAAAAFVSAAPAGPRRADSDGGRQHQQAGGEDEAGAEAAAQLPGAVVAAPSTAAAAAGPVAEAKEVGGVYKRHAPRALDASRPKGTPAAGAAAAAAAASPHSDSTFATSPRAAAALLQHIHCTEPFISSELKSWSPSAPSNDEHHTPRPRSPSSFTASSTGMPDDDAAVTSPCSCSSSSSGSGVAGEACEPHNPAQFAAALAATAASVASMGPQALLHRRRLERELACEQQPQQPHQTAEAVAGGAGAGGGGSVRGGTGHLRDGGGSTRDGSSRPASRASFHRDSTDGLFSAAAGGRIGTGPTHDSSRRGRASGSGGQLLSPVAAAAAAPGGGRPPVAGSVPGSAGPAAGADVEGATSSGVAGGGGGGGGGRYRGAFLPNAQRLLHSLLQGVRRPVRRDASGGSSILDASHHSSSYPEGSSHAGGAANRSSGGDAAAAAGGSWRDGLAFFLEGASGGGARDGRRQRQPSVAGSVIGSPSGAAAFAGGCGSSTEPSTHASSPCGRRTATTTAEDSAHGSGADDARRRGPASADASVQEGSVRFGGGSTRSSIDGGGGGASRRGIKQFFLRGGAAGGGGGTSAEGSRHGPRASRRSSLAGGGGGTGSVDGSIHSRRRGSGGGCGEGDNAGASDAAADAWARGSPELGSFADLHLDGVDGIHDVGVAARAERILPLWEMAAAHGPPLPQRSQQPDGPHSGSARSRRSSHCGSPVVPVAPARAAAAVAGRLSTAGGRRRSQDPSGGGGGGGLRRQGAAGSGDEDKSLTKVSRSSSRECMDASGRGNKHPAKRAHARAGDPADVLGMDHEAITEWACTGNARCARPDSSTGAASKPPGGKATARDNADGSTSARHGGQMLAELRAREAEVARREAGVSAREAEAEQREAATAAELCRLRGAAAAAAADAATAREQVEAVHGLVAALADTVTSLEEQVSAMALRLEATDAAAARLEALAAHGGAATNDFLGLPAAVDAAELLESILTSGDNLLAFTDQQQQLQLQQQPLARTTSGLALPGSGAGDVGLPLGRTISGGLGLAMGSLDSTLEGALAAANGSTGAVGDSGCCAGVPAALAAAGGSGGGGGGVSGGAARRSSWLSASRSARASADMGLGDIGSGLRLGSGRFAQLMADIAGGGSGTSDGAGGGAGGRTMSGASPAASSAFESVHDRGYGGGAGGGGSFTSSVAGPSLRGGGYGGGGSGGGSSRMERRQTPSRSSRLGLGGAGGGGDPTGQLLLPPALRPADSQEAGGGGSVATAAGPAPARRNGMARRGSVTFSEIEYVV